MCRTTGRVMPFVSARIGRGTDDVDNNGRSFDFDTHELGMGAEVVLREGFSLLVSYDRATFEYPSGFEIDSDALSSASAIGSKHTSTGDIT